MAVDVKKLFNEDLKAALVRHSADARKIGGKYQLNIAEAGSWYIDLSQDPPACNEGSMEKPDATIIINEANFQKLYTDPAKFATQMFFAGQLKVTGNQPLALNLQKLLALAAKP